VGLELSSVNDHLPNYRKMGNYMISERLPTYFLSHGGGPWPWMRDRFGSAYDKLEQSLQDVRHQVGSVPRAILMISGHWEENSFMVSSSPKPPMYYDYSGFPQHTYEIRYDAPGDPGLAETVRDLLRQGGLPTGLDPRRGFDHGTFSLAVPMYPEATLPLVQLSMKRDFDPAEHLAVGELLRPLRDEGVLIIGSGFSFHDTRRIIGGGGAEDSARFDQWLRKALVDTSPDERRKELINWQDAPAARKAHPREDHLIPLMVAVGAAGDDEAVRFYHEEDFMGSITVSSYRFGPVPS
jgi:aromatic ring-opening dioxygenase catalytic subunit (LigB family)